MSEFEALCRQVAEAPGALVYFGAPDCGVCGALRPRVEGLVREEFPRLAYRYLDCRAEPQAAAQFGVLAVPTVVVYFEGREWVRKVRAFSPGELREALERPYGLLFGESG